MTDEEIGRLRDDTRHLFYHGYDNYMVHAFPEDELKPISCQPQIRNRENPADIGLNDVLGNYSVTLIDSLSTLAILASDEDQKHAGYALKEFQSSVKALVGLYGDGSKDESGKSNCGSRACGFDLDSKVQVFETNIRGVGGLLSAHSFAVGHLPIRGYESKPDGYGVIKWKGGFKYDGQLLRLASDLASRLLPAFETATGLPYPRVNLRHGIPFYRDSEAGVCRLDGTSSDPREITETCSAGAGSLILEFATLSRLTGDMQFENLAKRAFWAVWERRSPLGLIGGGIDAESGQWTLPPLAGIGAGIDSFFEYALKSHILLSGLPYPEPYNTTTMLPDAYHDPASFLTTWQHAHTAVKRHIYRPATVSQHPYYAQSDLLTGAPRYTWIDNLSAYYPGLLALAGEVEEAIEAHLTYTALWTRYAALPERWIAGGHTGSAIDPSFKHWAGRPEFIESTWYLYQSTRDPWFLHVGEMTLRDIRRRCWTPCGWAALSDVGTGEQMDRMESFFLGETAKYLYLLFTPEHPLNTMDGAVVFTTEGHPLFIPPHIRDKERARDSGRATRTKAQDEETEIQIPAPIPTCPAPLLPMPLTVSNVANRQDLFHAAALAQLHLVPVNPARSASLTEPGPDGPGISLADVRSPSNYTFYPWTLPHGLIPSKGTSSPMRSSVVSTLTFPNLALGEAGSGGRMAAPGMVAMGALQKVLDGVFVNSLSNIRLNMVQESRRLLPATPAGMTVDSSAAQFGQEFRIHGIANWALGRDEKVMVSREALAKVSPVDPHFTRVKDLEMVDLVLDSWVAAGGAEERDGQYVGVEHVKAEQVVDVMWSEEEDVETELENFLENGTLADGGGLWNNLEALLTSILSPTASFSGTTSSDTADRSTPSRQLTRYTIPAILPTGIGAVPLPASLENSLDPHSAPLGQLPLISIYYLESTLCSYRLPLHIAKTYNILILMRGECSFADKLANIPSFTPGPEALQLVIVISTPESRSDSEKNGDGDALIRPVLDEVQRSPSGLERREGIAMVMVQGDEGTVAVLRGAVKTFGRFEGEDGFVVEETSRRGVLGGKLGSAGSGVKRRFWFESMGVPIGNLIVV
ncbi:hypothetical protein LTR62_005720 [Meristemomyces frigidus]|uniref:alpha-1,2-Mannosidase n=1 Tax=Meristemomyces frigidus TaxID=1508187 RepID=A0AAN7YN96_9PEZI|nr:hypothetical protein LTR62_005720 [Meristemomyces frigidus]